MPANASAIGLDGVICTEDGTAISGIPADTDKPNHPCDRCLNCVLCSSALHGLSNQSATLILLTTQTLAPMQTLETLLLALPDHLLPFSGAPPPFFQDQIMLHNMVVPVRSASTQLRIMPEIRSWH